MKRKNNIRCVFEGPGNTGKSTVIKLLAKELEKELSVSQYKETARQILEEEGFSSMDNFQGRISKLEDERLLQLEEDTADVLLIDRSCMSGLVYSIFNLDNGMNINMNQSGKGYYDLVILFTEAFKDTKTEQFEHYNDERLVKLFKDVLSFLYGDKVVEFKNASDIEDIKTLLYDKLNNR